MFTEHQKTQRQKKKTGMRTYRFMTTRNESAALLSSHFMPDGLVPAPPCFVLGWRAVLPLFTESFRATAQDLSLTSLSWYDVLPLAFIRDCAASDNCGSSDLFSM